MEWNRETTDKKNKENEIESSEKKNTVLSFQCPAGIFKDVVNELINHGIRHKTKNETTSVPTILFLEEDRETVSKIINSIKRPSLTEQISSPQNIKNITTNTPSVHVQKTPYSKIESPAGQNSNLNYRSSNQNFVPKNESIETEKQKIEIKNPEKNSDEDEKIEKEFPEKKSPKARKKLGRDIRKGARFTNDEWEKIEEKIKKSGLPEGEFIRTSLIKTKVVVKERTKKADEILENLKEIKSETGKIGGMMKQIMTKENTLSADEKEIFFAALKTIQDMKKELEQIERKV